MPESNAARIAAAALISGALCLGLTACYPYYAPGGTQASFDLYTYPGDPNSFRQITLIDLTTNQSIWTIEVPIGKQLVVRFYDDFNPSNTSRPALMRWEIMDLGESYGQLNNSMPVPASYNRRLDPSMVKPMPAAAAQPSESASPPPAPATPSTTPPTPPETPVPTPPPPPPPGQGVPRI